jgi:hypothetical protein
LFIILSVLFNDSQLQTIYSVSDKGKWTIAETKLTGKERSTRRKSCTGATLSITPLLQWHSLRARTGLHELDAHTLKSGESVMYNFVSQLCCLQNVLTSGTLRNTYTARQRATAQSIATKLQLHNREIVVRFPIKKYRDVSLVQKRRDQLWRPSSHTQRTTGRSFTGGVKPPRREANHSLHQVPQLGIKAALPPLPH